MADGPRYRVRPVTTPLPPHASARPHDADGNARTRSGSAHADADARDAFIRPATEDDDGYDPFSDRPPAPEPPFQEDPWN